MSIIVYAQVHLRIRYALTLRCRAMHAANVLRASAMSLCRSVKVLYTYAALPRRRGCLLIMVAAGVRARQMKKTPGQVRRIRQCIRLCALDRLLTLRRCSDTSHQTAEKLPRTDAVALYDHETAREWA